MQRKHAKDDTEKLWEKVPVCLRRLKGDDLPAVLQHRAPTVSFSFLLPLPSTFTIPSFLSLRRLHFSLLSAPLTVARPKQRTCIPGSRRCTRVHTGTGTKSGEKITRGLVNDFAADRGETSSMLQMDRLEERAGIHEEVQSMIDPACDPTTSRRFTLYGVTIVTALLPIGKATVRIENRRCIQRFAEHERGECSWRRHDALRVKSSGSRWMSADRGARNEQSMSRFQSDICLLEPVNAQRRRSVLRMVSLFGFTERGSVRVYIYLEKRRSYLSDEP